VAATLANLGKHRVASPMAIWALLDLLEMQSERVQQHATLALKCCSYNQPINQVQWFTPPPFPSASLPSLSALWSGRADCSLFAEKMLPTMQQDCFMCNPLALGMTISVGIKMCIRSHCTGM